MARSDEIAVSQQELAAAWQQELPRALRNGDKADVTADAADGRALRVHIVTAGHQMYDFDFKVTYVDTREIRIEQVDVEQGGESIDELREDVQELIADYRRRMHECAQALHELTHH